MGNGPLRGRLPTAVAVALVAGHAPAPAQELAPFRLTGVEGYVSMRYLKEQFDTVLPGGRLQQGVNDLRTEVFLLTHSYVYHPNFLTLDLGGGPVLQRARFLTDSTDTSSDSTLYNLTARASFLRDKPYRGSVFYEKLNPTLVVSPGSVMTQENTRSGFEFSLLEPVTIDIDAGKFSTRGRSVDLILDSQTDQFNLRASKPLGSHGVTQFRYQASTQSSLNGSPNLPIQRTDIDRRNAQLDTRVNFGAAEKYSLYNLIAFDQQKYTASRAGLPDRQERRVLLDLRGQESQRLKTFATYSFTSTDQDVYFVDAQAGSAGFTYEPAPESLLRLSGRAENTRSTQLDLTARGLDGSVQHRTRLGPGTLAVSYALRYDQRDQKANVPRVDVIGESLTLTGTAPVPLSRQRVVPNSVVVSNTTRTQTFIQGSDYVVTVVGVQVRVQRLLGGSIIDGQEVLVDFSFDPGGTYAATQTDQTLNVDWSFASYASLYVRLFRSAPEVTSGSPTAPLNEVRSTLFGARADVPLRAPLDLTVGGYFQQERRSETISPFRRRQLDVYAQAAIPWVSSGDVRIATRRINQDFENSPEDVRLVGWDLSLQTRHAPGIDVTATASYENDSGSTIPRSRWLGTGRIQWRHRSVTLTIDLTRSREEQDGYRRNRTLVQALLRRDL